MFKFILHGLQMTFQIFKWPLTGKKKGSVILQGGRVQGKPHGLPRASPPPQLQVTWESAHPSTKLDLKEGKRKQKGRTGGAKLPAKSI